MVWSDRGRKSANSDFKEWPKNDFREFCLRGSRSFNECWVLNPGITELDFCWLPHPFGFSLELILLTGYGWSAHGAKYFNLTTMGEWKSSSKIFKDRCWPFAKSTFRGSSYRSIRCAWPSSNILLNYYFVVVSLFWVSSSFSAIWTFCMSLILFSFLALRAFLDSSSFSKRREVVFPCWFAAMVYLDSGIWPRRESGWEIMEESGFWVQRWGSGDWKV